MKQRRHRTRAELKGGWYVALVIMSAAFITGCGSSQGDDALNEGPTTIRPESASVRFVEVGTMGREQQGNHVIFGHPVAVRTDVRGHVYVADKGSMSIVVLNREGELLRTVGGRGPGPGEFRDLTTMDIDPNGNIVVVDEMNMRITRFDDSGEVIDTHPTNPEVMLWPRRLRHLDDDTQIYLYKLPFDGPDGKANPESEFLFHTFRVGSQRPIASFGPIEVIEARRHSQLDFIYQFDPGHFCICNDRVVYSPHVYSGTLYSFERMDETWSLGSRISGYWNSPAFAVADRKEDLQSPWVINSGGKQHIASVYSQSIGVYPTSDGGLIHFTFRKGQDEAEIGVELFSEGGALLGYDVLQTIDYDDGAVPTRSPYEVAWKDDNGVYYIIDRSAEPIIRMVRAEIGMHPKKSL